MLPVHALGQSTGRRIPPANLEVTVQQREAGKLSDGLHILELSCWSGQCELLTITLNRCVTGMSGKSGFRPVVERTATADGDLRVVDTGSALVAEALIFSLSGTATVKHRFEYKRVGKSLMLSGYSGGFTKDSTLMNRILAVEYIPVTGDGYRELDCGAWLPTVEP